MKAHVGRGAARDATFAFMEENQFVVSLSTLCSQGFRHILSGGLHLRSANLRSASQGVAVSTATALEPCDIFALEYAVVDRLVQRYSAWAYLVNTLFALQIMQLVEDATLLRTLTPPEHYLRLLETRPRLVARLPQRELASYLGITESAMSRLVKRTREPLPTGDRDPIVDLTDKATPSGTTRHRARQHRTPPLLVAGRQEQGCS